MIYNNNRVTGTKSRRPIDILFIYYNHLSTRPFLQSLVS